MPEISARALTERLREKHGLVVEHSGRKVRLIGGKRVPFERQIEILKAASEALEHLKNTKFIPKGFEPRIRDLTTTFERARPGKK